MKFSKFLFKTMTGSGKDGFAKTRRAFLKNFDGAKVSKDLVDTLKRANSAWAEASKEPMQKDAAKKSPEAATENNTPRSAPNFSEHRFDFGVSQDRYRLFTPSRTDDSALPMLVMLHGCKQDALDFSKGIDMHELAEREKFVILYPEQLRKSNQSNCWNWFDPAHQSRGSGEPAMIAALTLKTAEAHGVDMNRIYVAGLSAGGAMAALAGKLYPEVFAAVGVHSGLAPKSARDVMSAFSVMANGPKSAGTVEHIGRPIIVFQGTSDHTVAAANATAVVNAELSQLNAIGQHPVKDSSEIASGANGHAAVRERWVQADGSTAIEAWTISGGGHAWSGGNAAGSYTDASGPSASQAMLRFFLSHRNRG